MRAKLVASWIAWVVLATGAMPAFAGYRCLAKGARMQAKAACCEHEPEAPAVGAPCCASFAAPRIEPRRTQPSPETKLPPPTVIGSIVYPAIAATLSSVELETPARARGRPPGEQLHLLSTILRV